MVRPRSGGKQGRIALPITLAGAGIGLGAALTASLPMLSYTEHPRALMVALVMSALAMVVGGLVGWTLGGRVASRLVDLSLAIAKLGRGGTEVKIRYTGTDEIAAIGRGLQYLAGDLAEMQRQQEQGGGSLAAMDPQVRQYRDRLLQEEFPDAEGLELDGALSAGSRGGLDYHDVVELEGGVAVVMVMGEGAGAMAVVASRLARDEIHDALRRGDAPRTALERANKAMKQKLPAGCCAKATLLHVGAEGATLYQAGSRAPLLRCARGEVKQLNAEGIALGLDDGPVFAKSLRPVEVPMAPGTRLCVVNEAAMRAEGFLALVQQHAPKHTAMFMNVVLGGIELDAGGDGLREDVLLVTVKKS